MTTIRETIIFNISQTSLFVTRKVEVEDGCAEEDRGLFDSYVPALQEGKAVPRGAGIPFQVVDVAADKAAREEMIKKTGQMGVPVIEIDGVVTVGFDEAVLKKQLGL